MTGPFFSVMIFSLRKYSQDCLANASKKRKKQKGKKSVMHLIKNARLALAKLSTFRLLLTAFVFGLVAQAQLHAQAVMPDPTDFIADVEAVAIAAAIVGATILLWVVGKSLARRLVKG